jgi:3-deoxy-manno-octulosonate cytidylyltransferase (CMP-KDO synthetase)
MRHPRPEAELHAVGVIPARYQSSRFPGKPLALIDGRSLVERVFERARAAERLTRLLVATDDDRIASAVRAFGGEVAMTSPAHETGTDRLAEVARSLAADLFVNIQGDEPLVDPRDIDQLVECLEADASADMATLAAPLPEADQAADPNVVKVVCDASGRALYFSRSAIPFARAGAPADRPWLRHVGLYAYRRGFLLQFASWSPGVLEEIEGLEQLRALERGRAIKVLQALGRYHGVDTPDDVRAVEQVLRTSSC